MKSNPRLKLTSNPEVDMVFYNYPEKVQEKIYNLRKLILQTAENMDNIDSIEETLKWGEPSYISNIGSTLRIAWKKKTPDQYGMYFTCSSGLVSTFREVFPHKFNYEGNRAIIFQLNSEIPVEELKKYIIAALQYHKVKHMPTLGIETASDS